MGEPNPQPDPSVADEQEIRLPSVWLFVGAYALALLMLYFVGPFAYEHLHAHPFRWGLVFGVWQFVVPAALFAIGFVTARWEVLAIPILVLPLVIIANTTSWDFNGTSSEPIISLKLLGNAAKSHLPAELFAVGFGVWAARVFQGRDRPEKQSFAPPEAASAVLFAVALVIETALLYFLQKQFSGSQFLVTWIAPFVSSLFFLGLFLSVFSLNSGWAVIPVLMTAFPFLFTTAIGGCSAFDGCTEMVRDNSELMVINAGVFAIATLVLSWWCRDDEEGQSEGADGPNAINSTRLPAGSET